MFNAAVKKPLYRPYLNIGGMFDIPTGKYKLGKHGESILDGGLGPLTGLTSRPNNFKTALAVFMQAMSRRAFPSSNGLIYDTEGTLTVSSRFTQVSRDYVELRDIDWDHDDQYTFTDISQYTGDALFKLYRDIVYGKVKDPKKYTLTTPFIDQNGNKRQAFYPTSFLIDSFSKFQISGTQEAYDKHEVGNAKHNTVPMTLGKAKTQLFDQLPTICAQTGSYIILTAHTGDIINIEMYPTDKRNLSHMKRDTIIKGVGPGFYSLPHNVWSIETNKPLVNKDKMAIYPVDNKTAMEGDSDLKILEVQNLRGKNGITGMLMKLIVSQTEGYLPALSEFHYCKEHGFGIGGNDRNYFMELRPDVNLSRTTVRKKLDDDPLLRRVAEIQAEMLQLIQFHREDPEGVFTDPKSLYEDLKTIGYDWEILLNTRGFWVFEEEEKNQPRPFLSTMDLLRMRKGLYVPWWYGTKDERTQLKANAAKLNAERLKAS